MYKCGSDWMQTQFASYGKIPALEPEALGFDANKCGSK